LSFTLINYADGDIHKWNRRVQVKSAEAKCKFNRIIKYKKSILRESFVSLNKELLDNPHGAGLWIWKPYILLHTLHNEVNEGDIVFYCDSDWAFLKDPEHFQKKAEEIDILLFHEDGDCASNWTAPNTFVHMDAYTEEYRNTTMLLGGYNLWKCCKKSIDFLEKWIQLCCRPDIILPINTYNGGHCYDQSILTILAKQEGIVAEPSPKTDWTICQL